MAFVLYLSWVLHSLPATQGSPLPRLPPGSPVPFGNNTALNNEIAPAWMPSAQVRGTSDILYSCLLTISLSVYSAVHLNVPPRGSTRRWLYLQKAKWTLLGIFAPEVVVYTAIHQFYDALKLQKSLSKIVKGRHDKAATKESTDPITTEALAKQEENATGESKTKHGNKKAATSKTQVPTFSLVYCFFVGMGGFVAELDDRELDYTSRYMTLTAEHLEQLARRGKFVEIEESEITDKSKADILAKILVCVQVMWLLVDCLARKVAGYPLTILEVHTFVHVFCALVMYGLWIKKPLNVGEPRLVSDLDVEEILDDICLMMMKSRKDPIRFGGRFFGLVTIFRLVEYGSKRSDFERVKCDQVGIVGDTEEVEPVSLTSGQQLSEDLVVTLYGEKLAYCPNRSCDSSFHKIRLNLSESDVARWKRVGRVVRRRYPAFLGQLPGIRAHVDQDSARRSGPSTSICDAGNDNQNSPDSRLGNSNVEQNAHAAGLVVGPSLNADVSSVSLPSQTGRRMQERPETEAGLRETQTLGSTITAEAHGSSANTVELGKRQIDSSQGESSGDKNHLLPAVPFARDWKFLQTDVRPRALNFDYDKFSQVVNVFAQSPPSTRTISWISFAILLGLMTAYGGIHLSVWSYDFPTEKERWLWRVASMNVAAFGWGYLLLALFSTQLRHESQWLILIVFFVFVLLCVASRIFIVVESFISLRTVPIGVYAAIPWAQYIPHI